MLKFFIRKPVTTVMFVLFFVILGLVSFPKMNIERTPSVDFPYVTATFIYPGASSEEIIFTAGSTESTNMIIM